MVNGATQSFGVNRHSFFFDLSCFVIRCFLNCFLSVFDVYHLFLVFSFYFNFMCFNDCGQILATIHMWALFPRLSASHFLLSFGLWSLSIVPSCWFFCLYLFFPSVCGHKLPTITRHLWCWQCMSEFQPLPVLQRGVSPPPCHGHAFWWIFKSFKF